VRSSASTCRLRARICYAATATPLWHKLSSAPFPPNTPCNRSKSGSHLYALCMRHTTNFTSELRNSALSLHRTTSRTSPFHSCPRLCGRYGRLFHPYFSLNSTYLPPPFCDSALCGISNFPLGIKTMMLCPDTATTTPESSCCAMEGGENREKKWKMPKGGIIAVVRTKRGQRML
jgi:hypothetical protein